MNTKCSFCGNTGFKQKNAQYIYRHNDKMLIINNVPCEECDFCGEKYYKSDVWKKIESEYNAIYMSGKKASHEVTIPLENYIEV